MLRESSDQQEVSSEILKQEIHFEGQTEQNYWPDINAGFVKITTNIH